jgi:nitroreductase
LNSNTVDPAPLPSSSPSSSGPGLELWQLDAAAYPATGKLHDKLVFLLNYAQLAPSARNSQPWQFAVQDNKVHVYPDFERASPVADPEQHELYLSLGCALENLLVAAEHFRLGYQVRFFSDPDATRSFASIEFDEHAATINVRDAALFDAIQRRHTNRSLYQRRLIPKEELMQLKAGALEKDLHLHFIANIDQKRQLAELVEYASQKLYANPAWRAELADWQERNQTGTAFGRFMLRHFNRGRRIGRHNAQRVISAPILIIIAADKDESVARIKSGQSFERLALIATKLQLAVQPLSGPLEIPALREQIAGMLPGRGLNPQMLFRVGFPSIPAGPTPRNPVPLLVNGQ